IIHDIGDGACLLRCISRRIYNTPNLHHVIGEDIITYTSQNLNTIILGSGCNTFHDYFSKDKTGQEYLNFMWHPYAYATNIESIAATKLYGMEFRITYRDQP
ncbi:unnamed protein product, partial [Ectocarpus sp. 4 AP-2014]